MKRAALAYKWFIYAQSLGFSYGESYTHAMFQAYGDLLWLAVVKGGQ